MIQLHLGDCLDVLRAMPEMSVDAIVTDPPYGLSFMGKKWDYDVPSVEIWRECLRVLKPGGHLLSFAGTRTQHRMAVNIEDAGFEIRDMIAWVYGSGFPKSLDVSKAIDKAAGAEREVVRTPMSKQSTAGKGLSNELDERPWMTEARKRGYHEHAGPIPATEAARQWNGWGTALKPALEPITVARRPIIGTVADNVLRHGTGAINVDGCRVGTEIIPPQRQGKDIRSGNWSGNGPASEYVSNGSVGRWPANLIHDGSDEVVGLFPESTSRSGNPERRNHRQNGNTYFSNKTVGMEHNDSGSAARFFYCAKASKADRDEGCEGLEERDASKMSGGEETRTDRLEKGMTNHPQARNHHPTVKPTSLMRYLCRLVTPPGGIVLDPFMGSGSTGKAAVLESFNFIGIEREPEYMEIARRRIHAVQPKQESVVVSPTYVQPSLF